MVDLGQPQGLGLVAVVGELVRERPGLDVVVLRGVLADLGGDARQALTGPEGCRDLGGVALRARRAVPVHRDVGPEGGVRRLEVGREALEGLRRQATLLRREHDAGRGLRRVDAAVALPVVDALDPAAGRVRRSVDVGLAVQRVVVGLLAVEVRQDVALAVLDVVEVPPPGLLARRVGEGGVVAGLTRVVAEDRGGPDGVGLLVARGPAGKAALAEVVLGAVRRGDLPVLTVVVAVHGAGELLDLGTAVGPEPPFAVGVALDQLGGGAVEHHGGVVEGPALLCGARLAVLRAGLVPALDVAGLVGEALTDPGALVVGVRGTPVRRLRGIAQPDRRREAAGSGRRAQRVRPGEGARGVRHFPFGRRGERSGRVVALAGGAARSEGDQGAGRGRSGRHGRHARRARRSGHVRRHGLRLRVVDRLERLGQFGAGRAARLGDRRAGREFDQAQAGTVAAAEAVGERRVVDVQPDLAVVPVLLGAPDAQQSPRTEGGGALGVQDVDLHLVGRFPGAEDGGPEGTGRRIRCVSLGSGDGDGQAADLHGRRGDSLAGCRDGHLCRAGRRPDRLVQLLDGRFGSRVGRAGLGLGLRPLDGVSEVLDAGPLGTAGGGLQCLHGRGGQSEAQTYDDGAQSPSGHAPIEQSAA